MTSCLSNEEFCWMCKFFTTCLFGWIWHKGFTNVFIFVLYIFPAYLYVRFVCFKVSCCFDLSFISILTFYITPRRSEFSSWWLLLSLCFFVMYMLVIEKKVIDYDFIFWTWFFYIITNMNLPKKNLLDLGTPFWDGWLANHFKFLLTLHMFLAPSYSYYILRITCL